MVDYCLSIVIEGSAPLPDETRLDEAHLADRSPRELGSVLTERVSHLIQR
jgi:hypothetical protein